MADAYFVTIEADDGMLWDDPWMCDTEREAREHAALKKPPPGYSTVLYRAYHVDVLASTPLAAPDPATPE